MSHVIVSPRVAESVFINMGHSVVEKQLLGIFLLDLFGCLGCRTLWLLGGIANFGRGSLWVEDIWRPARLDFIMYGLSPVSHLPREQFG